MSDETLIPQPKIKFSWIIGILAAFALFAVIGAYSKRMTETYTDYDEARAQQRYATLAKLQQDEAKLINPVAIDPTDGKPHSTAEWVDQDKGLIRIPIEEAMAKEVVDLKAKPTQAAAEINPPAPPAPASPAPTNGAPAKPAAPANSAPQVKSALLSPDLGSPPAFKTRKINTRVIIREGKDIVLIGGLIKMDTVNTNTTPTTATPPPVKPTL
jgi:predicted outer membrane lipoprotein